MSDASIRAQIASNLDALARILRTNKIVNDTGPLSLAANQCRSSYNSGRWGYDVSNLIFRKLGNLKKIPIEADEITIELSLSIEGYCEPEEQNDPLTKLDFNLHIYGEYLSQDETGEINIKRVVSSYHLDRHQHNEGDGQSMFTHPLYHFQYGGHYLKNSTDDQGNRLDFGAALFLDSPRIPHPPMDAIIGVDFILVNFIGSSLSFREEGNYRNIIRPAQKKLWKPYADAITATWQENSHLYPWPPSLLWPQLMLPEW